MDAGKIVSNKQTNKQGSLHSRGDTLMTVDAKKSLIRSSQNLPWHASGTFKRTSAKCARICQQMSCKHCVMVQTLGKSKSEWVYFGLSRPFFQLGDLQSMHVHICTSVDLVIMLAGCMVECIHKNNNYSLLPKSLPANIRQRAFRLVYNAVPTLHRLDPQHRTFALCHLCGDARETLSHLHSECKVSLAAAHRIINARPNKRPLPLSQHHWS